jgi:hypothetical protein
MSADDITKILGGLGLGAGTGAVLTAIINSQTNKGKARAEAADLLVGAAERVGKLNAELDCEVRELKLAMDRIQVAMLQYLSEDISREELLNVVKEIRK